MKKIIYVFVLLTSSFSYGQNSYPASGTAILNSGGDQSLIIKDGRSGTNWNYVEWQFSNGTRDWVLGRKSTNGFFTLYRNGVNDVLTVDNAGNVGIGTTSPGSKLHVAGGNLYVGPFSGTNPAAGRIAVSGPIAEVSLSNRLISSFVESPTLGERWVIYNDGLATDGKLRFWSGGDKMILTKEGNVGIGTINPNQKLTVNGTIYGKEVKVDLSVPGPDYVFSNNYQLLTINELKAYIDQHKHLPEVPSAKEMEASGINLGEMNMLLLKKIEELTLYMIDLKNENSISKKRINEMQIQIDQLTRK